MRIIKLLGLVLLASAALGAVAVASASATERGLLFLDKETGPVTLSGVEGSATYTLAIEGSEPSISCHALKLSNVTLSEPSTTHVNLGKNGTLQYSECRRGAIACSSVNTAGVKDAKETVLVQKDGHAINLEGEKGELLPGLAILILNDKNEVGPTKVDCGGVVIEIKGAALGQVFPLNAKKVVTLTEDVTDLDAKFQSVKCDKTEEKVCQELLEKEPLQANVGAGFKASKFTSTLFLATASKMLLVDD